MPACRAKNLIVIVFCALVGFFSGCGTAPPGVFLCAGDGDCDRGSDGRCEGNGFCSYIDVTCESDRRFGEHAGDESGQCVVSQASEVDASSSEIDSDVGDDPNAPQVIDALVGHWKFDDTAGLPVATIGSDFDELSAAPTYAVPGPGHESGDIGMRLEPTCLAIERQTGEVLELDRDFSVAFWIRLVAVEGTTGDATRALEIGSYGDGEGMQMLLTDSGYFYLRQHTTPGEHQDYPLSSHLDDYFLDQSWHHVALRYQHATPQFNVFYDGVAVGNVALASPLNDDDAVNARLEVFDIWASDDVTMTVDVAHFIITQDLLTDGEIGSLSALAGVGQTN